MTDSAQTNGESMDSARIQDTNGWYEIRGNPISKFGVFPYLGSQIPGAPDPTKIYMVYRPESELSDPECMSSFRLLPWIDEHQFLGSEEDGCTPAEKKGVQGVIGEDIYYDAPHLRANVKVWSEALKNLIESGKKQISAAFRCEYFFESGIFNGQRYDVIQRSMRGNHIALVDEGRVGPDVAVLDSADRKTATCDAGDLTMAEQPENQGGGTGEMTLSQVAEMLKGILPQIQELTGFMQKMKPLEEAEHGEVLDAPAADPVAEDKPAAMDAQIKALQAEVKALKSAKPAAMDSGEVMKAIAARDALVSKLTPHIGAFDHVGMTAEAVAKYGVQKLGIACDSGAEVAALTGYLHGRQAPTASATFTLGHGADSANKPSAIASQLGV